MSTKQHVLKVHVYLTLELGTFQCWGLHHLSASVLAPGCINVWLLLLTILNISINLELRSRCWSVTSCLLRPPRACGLVRARVYVSILFSSSYMGRF